RVGCVVYPQIDRLRRNTSVPNHAVWLLQRFGRVGPVTGSFSPDRQPPRSATDGALNTPIAYRPLPLRLNSYAVVCLSGVRKEVPPGSTHRWQLWQSALRSVLERHTQV